MGKYEFKVRESARVRVIIDTDAACEADDQYAVVHALLTPKFEIKGIISEQFNNAGGEGSEGRSYDEIKKLLSLMDIEDINVLHGSAYPLGSGEMGEELSEGAQLIINEAMREDERPLFVLCQGAITNVAAALIKAPETAGRFICIWIGGAPYPNGGWEFNLLNDRYAANIVFASGAELWQVPMNCYTKMQVGYAELQKKVMPCGKIGKYLFDELYQLGMKVNWTQGESWALGDSPAPALALNPLCGSYKTVNAPIVNDRGEYIGKHEHMIRVYDDIDTRYILEDFFAKLSVCYGDE